MEKVFKMQDPMVKIKSNVSKILTLLYNELASVKCPICNLPLKYSSHKYDCDHKYDGYEIYYYIYTPRSELIERMEIIKYGTLTYYFDNINDLWKNEMEDNPFRNVDISWFEKIKDKSSAKNIVVAFESYMKVENLLK